MNYNPKLVRVGALHGSAYKSLPANKYPPDGSGRDTHCFSNKEPFITHAEPKLSTGMKDYGAKNQEFA